MSSTGVSLSLQDYSRAMLYQNPRMQYMGRLAQEWALVMHCLHVENFQKNKELQARLQRRRRDAEVRRGVDGVRGEQDHAKV